MEYCMLGSIHLISMGVGWAKFFRTIYLFSLSVVLNKLFLLKIAWKQSIHFSKISEQNYFLENGKASGRNDTS